MYSCLICKEQNFSTLQIFYKHLYEHKSKHSCPKCDEILINRNQRRRHCKQHVRITCNICNVEYEKLNRGEHLKYHEYLYSVDQLNSIVDIINEMQDCSSSQAKRQKTCGTIEEYRGTQPNCPVKKCDKKFQNQNDLINHFINHRTNHLCKYCGEIFPDNKTYEAHTLNKLCRLYTCHICNKDFSFERFIRHIMSECAKKNLFDNIDSNKPIETYNSRKIYRIYDEIQYSFTCFVCEDVFNNLELLTDHLITHNKKLNVCAKCFCVFNENSELQDHIRLGCENIAEIPAAIREKLTNEIKQYLEAHTRSRHHLVVNKKVCEITDDTVLFQCNVCSSKFVKFVYLKEHCAKLNHELIICYECLYLFNSRPELHKHFCEKIDYDSFTELEFRKQFQKCLKRQIETGTETEEMPLKKPHIQKFLYHNDDVVRRMETLIKQLENTKFPNRKGTTNFKDIPSTSTVKSNNDDYDLNKILPRILERRNKRLFHKPSTDEDSEEELEKIEHNLHDLDICKKHLLIENTEYDLDQVLPRILKLRNKRHFHEMIENEDINRCSEDQNMEQPPNKRIKNNSENSEDSLDNLIEIESEMVKVEL